MTPAQAAATNLAAALRRAGLEDMAVRAERGHYGDFSSPLIAPKMTLVIELERAGTGEARAVAQRVRAGDFDG
jgi:hypothetical protein